MHFLPVFLLCIVSWFVLEARALTSSEILFPMSSHTEAFPSVYIRHTGVAIATHYRSLSGLHCSWRVVFIQNI